MGAVGFRSHHHTRRPLVQTVHDARSFHPADTREISTVVEQGVDEGSARVAGAGVHDHSRRLVDYDQFVVLVQNFESNFLRLDWGCDKRRRSRFDLVSNANRLAGSIRLRVDPDAIVVDPTPGL